MTILDTPLEFQSFFGRLVIAALDYDAGRHDENYIYSWLLECFGLECHHIPGYGAFSTLSQVTKYQCRICHAMIVNEFAARGVCAT